MLSDGDADAEGEADGEEEAGGEEDAGWDREVEGLPLRLAEGDGEDCASEKAAKVQRRRE